jgi:2',3'-cyclic-nucleotide 2'-phosphodiesterase
LRALFLGDIVGLDAAEYVIDRMPSLRSELKIDLAIVNAENALQTGPQIRTGFGMSAGLVDRLMSAGIDVITGGNHSWDGEMAVVEGALSHPRVLRPANVPAGVPGKGSLTITVGDEEVTIINLMSASAVVEPTPLFQRWLREPERVQPLWSAWQAITKSGTTIVDLHGLAISEKQAFAHAIDGEVAAVLGTHTHEATYHLHVLPKGTALVSDVGMTGRLGGVTGIGPDHWVKALQGGDVLTMPAYRLADGPMTLGAVVIDISDGRTTNIQRVF